MIWNIDNSHTNAGFTVRHMMISTVHGRFGQVSGTLNFDPANPEAASIEAYVEAASIDTRDEKRDGHLRSADFFNVENYPRLSLVSKKVEKTGEDTFKVTTDLTIKDVTREVVFDVAYHGQGVNPWGMTVLGMSATTTFNRKDFGLNWNVALEAGGVLVSDKVTLNLEVQAVQAPVAVSV
jgi:polyisoprenoid-binding protein YceI